MRGRGFFPMRFILCQDSELLFSRIYARIRRNIQKNMRKLNLKEKGKEIAIGLVDRLNLKENTIASRAIDSMLEIMKIQVNQILGTQVDGVTYRCVIQEQKGGKSYHAKEIGVLSGGIAAFPESIEEKTGGMTITEKKEKSSSDIERNVLGFSRSSKKKK